MCYVTAEVRVNNNSISQYSYPFTNYTASYQAKSCCRHSSPGTETGEDWSLLQLYCCYGLSRQEVIFALNTDFYSQSNHGYLLSQTIVSKTGEA